MSSTTATLPVSPASSTKPFVRYATATVRVLLGLVFFVFGLTGLLNLIPPPSEPLPQGLMDFNLALMKTGYMFPFIKGTETLVGLLLLSNRFVPLALVILMPITLNILALNLFLMPAGVPMAVVILALQLFLAWSYRAAYRPLLTAKFVR